MFIYHGHVFILIFITFLFKGAEPSQFSWSVPKKSRKAPPSRTQNKVVLAQEMKIIYRDNARSEILSIVNWFVVD